MAVRVTMNSMVAKAPVWRVKDIICVYFVVKLRKFVKNRYLCIYVTEFLSDRAT